MQRNNLQFWSFLHNHTLIPVKSVYLNFIYVSVTDIKRLLKKSNPPPLVPTSTAWISRAYPK